MDAYQRYTLPAERAANLAAYQAQADIARRGNASASGIVKRRRPVTLTRSQKARALVDCGECDSMREAREYLADMGE
jgi:hypothetical protein